MFAVSDPIPQVLRQARYSGVLMSLMYLWPAAAAQGTRDLSKMNLFRTNVPSALPVSWEVCRYSLTACSTVTLPASSGDSSNFLRVSSAFSQERVLADFRYRSPFRVPLIHFGHRQRRAYMSSTYLQSFPSLSLACRVQTYNTQTEYQFLCQFCVTDPLLWRF